MTIETIMLIDDNEVDQFLNATIVSRFDPNVKILKAYDGQEALAMLAKLDSQPDLILLDINMPGMNGFEFLDEYIEQEDASSIVAMLSSSEQEKDRERAMSYECVRSYLVKPLEVEDLKQIAAML